MCKLPRAAILVPSVFILGLASACSSSPSGEASASSTASAITSGQLQSLKAALDIETHTLAANPSSIDAILAFQLGIAVNEVSQDPNAAEQYVATYGLNRQDMNPSDEAFGSFHGEDANTTAFCGLGMAVFYNRVHGSFSTQTLADYRARMHAAGEWLTQHPINGGVSYTNIYLLTSVDIILLGEASGDATLAARGYSQLEEWYGYTRAAGIAEFVSPTYTAVDLAALNMGYALATDPTGRSKMRAALDLVWTDIKANYFAGQGTLAGAHSRDYDWLQGVDTVMSLYLSTEGGQDGFPLEGGTLAAGAPVNMVAIYLFENALFSTAYHPQWDTLPGANDPTTPRAVSESFPVGVTANGGAAVVGQRTSYTTQDFSVAAASSSVGWQDKLLDISLHSLKKDFPQITLNFDVDGNPFGEDDYEAMQTLGSDVHNHAPMNPASVQDGAAVLSTFDVDPHGTQTDVTTSLILPGQADSIVVDGAAVSPATMTSGQEIAVRNNAWIEIREGNSGLVMEFSIADRLNGALPAVALRSDTIEYYDYVQNSVVENLKVTRPLQVLRLVAHHYLGPAVSVEQTHLRGVIYANAVTVTSDAQWASFKGVVESHAITLEGMKSSSEWTAGIVLPSGHALVVNRWLDDPNHYQAQVDGQVVANPTMTVNGVDVTPALAFFTEGL